MTGSRRPLPGNEPGRVPRAPFDSSRVKRYRKPRDFRGSTRSRGWHAPCCSISVMGKKREAGKLAVGVPGVVMVNNLIVVVKGDSRAEGSPLPADSLFIARTE